MLYERKDLPELHKLKHFHDNNDQYVDYEKNILNSSLSPHMYENDLMFNWLNRMQPLVSILFDQMNVLKNMKNWTVDKYYYKHSR
jgi:hypothetical protein